MPVMKYTDITPTEITMPGVHRASKANVVGESDGWYEYTLRVFRLGPGGCTPRHQHDWEHVNHIIKGRGQLMLGDQVHELGEKDFALVPANTLHQFQNPFDEDLEFICIVPNRGA